MRLAVITVIIAFIAGIGGDALAGEKLESIPEDVFLLGGDISMLARIEELGGTFFRGGEAGNLIYIMKSYGCNAFRLRLFVNPSGRNAVVNDLHYTLALARRIREAGMTLILDLHYSDTWADPGKQYMPEEWEGLEFEALEARVRDYTATVITAFRERDILPRIVQIGNEITGGMLWPAGKMGGSDKERDWVRFTRLLRAAVDGIELSTRECNSPRIMIHIDRSCDPGGTAWFFDHMEKYEVPFHIIGFSYYPWWHGSLEELRVNLKRTAQRYQRDILIVETAYPFRAEKWWKDRDNMDWEISPQGQKNFLEDLIETVRGVPGRRGMGVLYWYPESIPVAGLEVWNGGATALFDRQGQPLPALGVFSGETGE